MYNKANLSSMKILLVFTMLLYFSCWGVTCVDTKLGTATFVSNIGAPLLNGKTIDTKHTTLIQGIRISGTAVSNPTFCSTCTLQTGTYVCTCNIQLNGNFGYVLGAVKANNIYQLPGILFVAGENEFFVGTPVAGGAACSLTNPCTITDAVTKANSGSGAVLRIKETSIITSEINLMSPSFIGGFQNNKNIKIQCQQPEHNGISIGSDNSIINSITISNCLRAIHVKTSISNILIENAILSLNVQSMLIEQSCINFMISRTEFSQLLPSPIQTVYGVDVAEMNQLAFFTCQFKDHANGALKISDSKLVEVVDCSFTNNNAEDGAGIHLLSSDLVFKSNHNHLLARQNTASNRGGFLFAKYSDVTIQGIMRDNKALDGGAMYLEFSNKMSWQGTECRANIAVNRGGCAFINGATNPIWANTNLISLNKAKNGGGLFVYNGFSSTGATFIFNAATQFGGAIYVAKNSKSLKDNTINSATVNANKADIMGGGVFAESGAQLIITAGAYTSNQASVGGAIAFRGAKVAKAIVITCNQNSASLDGGCIYATLSKIKVAASTLNGNLASNGAAIALFDIEEESELLSNTFENNNIMSNVIGISSKQGNGGAIFTIKAPITLSGTTKFKNNVASFGGCIFGLSTTINWIGSAAEVIGNRATVTLSGNCVHLMASHMSFGGTLHLGPQSILKPHAESSYYCSRDSTVEVTGAISTIKDTLACTCTVTQGNFPNSKCIGTTSESIAGAVSPVPNGATSNSFSLSLSNSVTSNSKSALAAISIANSISIEKPTNGNEVNEAELLAPVSLVGKPATLYFFVKQDAFNIFNGCSAALERQLLIDVSKALAVFSKISEILACSSSNVQGTGGSITMLIWRASASAGENANKLKAMINKRSFTNGVLQFAFSAEVVTAAPPNNIPTVNQPTQGSNANTNNINKPVASTRASQFSDKLNTVQKCRTAGCTIANGQANVAADKAVSVAFSATGSAQLVALAHFSAEAFGTKDTSVFFKTIEDKVDDSSIISGESARLSATIQISVVQGNQVQQQRFTLASPAPIGLAIRMPEGKTVKDICLAARQLDTDPLVCDAEIFACVPPTKLPANQIWVCAKITHLTSFAVLLGGSGSGSGGSSGLDSEFWKGESLVIFILSACFIILALSIVIVVIAASFSKKFKRIYRGSEGFRVAKVRRHRKRTVSFDGIKRMRSSNSFTNTDRSTFDSHDDSNIISTDTIEI